MRIWFRKHRLIARLLWAALALAATESALLVYYLNSWLTLPLL
jgi:hypothetical protein